MQIRREDEQSLLALDMTPLIDMLFILIIFFLATSRFQQEERDEAIQLVNSKSSLPIATASELLVIEIDKDGRKKVHGLERTLEEIEEIIRASVEENKESDIVVRADRRAIVAHLLETTEICHRLGINDPKVTYAQE